MGGQEKLPCIFVYFPLPPYTYRFFLEDLFREETHRQVTLSVQLFEHITDLGPLLTFVPLPRSGRRPTKPNKKEKLNKTKQRNKNENKKFKPEGVTTLKRIYTSLSVLG